MLLKVRKIAKSLTFYLFFRCLQNEIKNKILHVVGVKEIEGLGSDEFIAPDFFLSSACSAMKN